MVTDLHTRLRSAIETRLALAQAATPGPWQHVGKNWIKTTPIDVTEADWGPEGHNSYFIHTNEGPGAWRVEDARFIAANDPEFVIRACRADLQRLERHKPVNDDHSPMGVGCDWCEADPGDRDPWPCIEVRSLAEVYEEAL